MIVKVIQHNSMPRSAAYLYRKEQGDPINAGSHPRYSSCPTIDDFMYALNHLMEMRSDKTGRDLTVNNQIKHLVLSCHPSDNLIFDIQKEKILSQLFEELKIEPDNHLVNVFVHNDRSHPHIHVLFSRIGEDLSIFEDGNIGKRMGDFAERISKQYGLKFRNEKPRMSIDHRFLFKPTAKGDLLKLIDFATKEAEHLVDFNDILKRHGVRTRVTTDDKVIYMTLNPALVPKEEVAMIIQELSLLKLSREKYKKELSKYGIGVKWNDEGKEIYSRQNYKFWHEDKMPKEAKIKFLYKAIRTKRLDPKYQEARNILTKGINECETLGDIKDLLPGCKMKFQQRGSKIMNVTIEYDDMLIRLHEVFTKDISIDNSQYKNDPFQVPIIFIPRYYDKDAAEWEFLQKKKSKRGNKITFRL